MKKQLISFVSIFLLTILSCAVYSQDIPFSFLIDSELKADANAVLHLDSLIVEIPTIKQKRFNYTRVITILNSSGNKHAGAYAHYDKDVKITNIKAKIYNQFGQEIERFRRSDFEDVSAVSDISLYEDSRVLYLSYTPTEYPYTIEFHYETTTDNTHFVPFWMPLDDYEISTKKSTYTIKTPVGVNVSFNEMNFGDEQISKVEGTNEVTYTAQNLLARKEESYAPSFNETAPRLMVSLDRFHYNGYEGQLNNWEEFGKWFHDNLLLSRKDLPSSTVAEVQNLVQGISDPVEKAKVLYKYMQDRTRYISVQVGIGGLQPQTAKSVDQLKYGDCKGLTNYMKALLEAVDVPSNYVRIYGSRTPKSVHDDFVTFAGQTNHAILQLPTDDGPIWLECTDQQVPFGHIANFTDDRNAFVITPQGGKIERTTVYTENDNVIALKADITINDEGGFDAVLSSEAKGSFYGLRNQIKDLDTKDRLEYYRNKWDHLNDIQFYKMDVSCDYESAVASENFELSVAKFADKLSDKLVIPVGVFNTGSAIPSRSKNRKSDFVINRSYTNSSESVFKIPKGFQIDFIPEKSELQTEFGTLVSDYEKRNNNEIIYKRTLVIKKGQFEPEKYNDYRDFIKKIRRIDRSTIVLKRS
ncbi:MAG: DUF3857 domain-containing protein [bacterium]